MNYEYRKNKRNNECQNISNYKLVKLSGKSIARIGKIINGVHTDPKIETVKSIAIVLDVDINEII